MLEREGAGRRRAVLAAGVAFLVVAAGCGPRPWPHRKRRLATLPRSVQRDSIEIPLAGDRVAYVVRTPEGNEYVVDDGKPQPRHHRCGRLNYAPKERHLLYWTYDETPPTLGLVYDGAMPLQLGSKQQPKVMSLFGKVGVHWVAGAVTESDGRRGVTLVTDGITQGRYADLSRPAFSRDGRHVAYVVEDEDGARKLVVDGVVRRVFAKPEVDASPLRRNEDAADGLSPHFLVEYLSDGSLLVLGTDRDGWAVCREDTRLASYVNNAWRGGDAFMGVSPYQHDAGILSTTLAVGEQAPVAVWWERLAGEEERWRVMKDGKPVDDRLCTKPLDSQPPTLTPDGQHLLYACFQRDEGGVEVAHLIVDGEARFAPVRQLWGLALSNDARHVAYAASDAKPEDFEAQGWELRRDGVPLIAGRYDAIWRPRFSDDGAHVAWEAQRGGRGARGVLGLDGREIASFDNIYWGPEYDQPGFVSWIIRRNHEVTRVEIGLR